MEAVTGRTPQWMTLDVVTADTNGDLPTEIVGCIPAWLSGCLFRNGAGLYKVNGTNIRHFFDGFSVIHKFNVRDGQVTYRSSLLDTNTVAEAMGIKRLVPTKSGPKSIPDPCKSVFKGSQTYFAELPPERTDNTSVSVVEFADALYALTETATMNKIDRDSLKRTEMIDLSKIVSIHTGTAHPHFNPNGDMFTYGTSFDYRQAFNIVKIPRHLEGSNVQSMSDAEILASVPSRWQNYIAYNHSFGMSDRYFVLLDQPVTFNTKKFQISHVDMQGVAGTLVVKKGESLQFHVIDRQTSRRLPYTYETTSSFVFHFINCFEEDGFLVVDLVLYHKVDAILDLYLESLRKTDFVIPDAGSFARFVLPLNLENAPCDINLVGLCRTKATAVIDYDNPKVVSLTPDYLRPEKIVLELPRINYQKYAGKKYRFVYGSSVFSDCYRLVKVDLEEKTYKEWKQTQYYYPGEPIFVPAPDAVDEDDGVVMSPVLCETLEEPSFLLILDAKSFTELARAYIPRDVKMSMTFHGTFSDDTKSRNLFTSVDIHL
ncbi:carotenoid isomerooxygenase-like [Biomphalaria glabrata]|uniref:Carotenoid isomerooxygenase-like n=1 Tax=Biomphalaria glabrata TaxID=6526 RepID=A0A9W2YQ39_BIOGL|nr:carotenoid isomerooxygenase-like [Biomphalaria glabrata]